MILISDSVRLKKVHKMGNVSLFGVHWKRNLH